MPFIGTSEFNFYGGSGTGQTISIDKTGMTVIQSHGAGTDGTSSTDYQGQFSNLKDKDGSEYLIKDNKIYLMEDGQFVKSCIEENAVCESTLNPLDKIEQHEAQEFNTVVNHPSESVQEFQPDAGLNLDAEPVAKTNNAATIKANASSTELIMAMIQFANDYEKQIEARKRVEALPKPKHGNKKEARKLNDQALALAKQANYQDALPIMESAYKADSADVEVVNNLAYLEVMLNDFKSAKKYLFETLILKPDRSGAWADLGRVFVAEGSEEYAKNCYINFFIASKNPDAALKHLTTEVPDNPVLTRVKQAANEEISLWSSGD
ncbi:MAG: tetratricopeptide repeat protein [Methylococcaceae bacterium]